MLSRSNAILSYVMVKQKQGQSTEIIYIHAVFMFRQAEMQWHIKSKSTVPLKKHKLVCTPKHRKKQVNIILLQAVTCSCKKSCLTLQNTIHTLYASHVLARGYITCNLKSNGFIYRATFIILRSSYLNYQGICKKKIIKLFISTIKYN